MPQGVGGLNTFSNYSLNFVLSPLSNILVSHSDAGILDIEGEYNLWQSALKDQHLSLYGKHVFNGLHDITTTNQLVYNYGLDYMVNLGIRDWKIKSNSDKTAAPETFTIGGMMRVLQDANNHVWTGLQLAFGTRRFNEVQALIGANFPNKINGIMQLSVGRKVETVVTPLTESKLDMKVTYPKLLKVGLETKISETFYLYNLFTSSLDESMTMSAQIGGLYTFDPYTSMRFRIQDDLTTSISLTRRYRNLLDFTFIGTFHVNKAKKTEIEKTTTTTKVHGETTNVSTDITATTKNCAFVTSKFGLTISMLDDSLL